MRRLLHTILQALIDAEATRFGRGCRGGRDRAQVDDDDADAVELETTGRPGTTCAATSTGSTA